MTAIELYRITAVDRFVLFSIPSFEISIAHRVAYVWRVERIDYIWIYVYFIFTRMRTPFHAEYHDIRRRLASH